MSDTISAIVPTIGRPSSLRALLDALASQTRIPDEVVIADASASEDTRQLAAESQWLERRLVVKHVAVRIPNAVAQRKAAIAASTGALLLLLDDDVVPEPECVQELATCLAENNAVAVGADFANHEWPVPTKLWRCYLACCGVRGKDWQGKVIGPLLRFGYNPTPAEPARMDWVGGCNTLMLRSAYERVGGFSDFFLHRSTMNEDVDLGLKLLRVGSIFLCPTARLAHLQAPGGRMSTRAVAEDDLYNRYCILRYTQGLSILRALSLVAIFLLIETMSGFFGGMKDLRFDGFSARLLGRLRALVRIATS